MGCIGSTPDCPGKNEDEDLNRSISRQASREDLIGDGDGINGIATRKVESDSRPTLNNIFGDSLDISAVIVAGVGHMQPFNTLKLKTPPSQFNPILGLRYGHYEDIGGRDSMEDAACQINTNENCAFFGVFDGHGGHTASRFVAEHLHERLLSICPVGGSDDEVRSAVESACAGVDDDFLAEGVGDDSGSTAIFMVYFSNRKVVIGGVGDSYAIISSNNEAELLSVEHKPDVPSEKARIEAANGKVVQGRVFGMLGVSRAFGDRDLKTSRGRYASKFNGDVVISVPHLTFRTLRPSDEFIVLACDGLLDVMKPQQVISFVREKLEEHCDVQKAAMELVLRATKRLGSKDNVTATIICFPQVRR